MSIWTKLIKKIFFWSCSYLYNYIDSNKDGKISKQELKTFHDSIKVLLNLVKKKK